ncbi:MAG: mycothiol synthase [Actinomycetota bacterium]
MISVAVSEALDLPTVVEVRSLARWSEQKFDAPQLNDHALLLITAQTAGLVHLLASDDARLVGYAQLEQDASSSTVQIAAQSGAVDALFASAAERAGTKRGLRVWAHGRHSPVAPVAERLGMRRDRVLWQLRRPLTDLPAVRLPDGITIRAFVSGQDDDAWLAVNAAAFATHAEQGRWTRADLESRKAEAWFDASGFLLAERGGQLAGFHWTKVHPDGPGEVYVLGVAPSAQGIGLGPALLAAGLEYLAGRGCAEVLLYSDESNDVAMRLYERVGFHRHDLDVQYVT